MRGCRIPGPASKNVPFSGETGDWDPSKPDHHLGRVPAEGAGLPPVGAFGASSVEVLVDGAEP